MRKIYQLRAVGDFVGERQIMSSRAVFPAREWAELHIDIFRAICVDSSQSISLDPETIKISIVELELQEAAGGPVPNDNPKMDT